MDEDAQNLRLLEALIFASATTLDEAALSERLPEGIDIPALLAQLAELYASRGVNLVKVAGGWTFRSAPDLKDRLQIEKQVSRKLSRAAVETLAIIAYHQPVTRAEIEAIRGVGLSKGTLDLLFEQGWIQPLGRRRAPGLPVTWGSTTFFLEHFGLGSLEDLPGFEELKAAGLLDANADVSVYRPDEPDLPLEAGESEEADEPLDSSDPTDEPADPPDNDPAGHADAPDKADDGVAPEPADGEEAGDEAADGQDAAQPGDDTDPPQPPDGDPDSDDSPDQADRGDSSEPTEEKTG